MYPAMGTYVPEGNVWYSGEGRRSERVDAAHGRPDPAAVFLSLGDHRTFDRLRGNTRTWYEKWGYACLKAQVLLTFPQLADMYQAAFDAMIADGILVQTDHQSGPVLGIAPEALILSTDLAFIASKGRTRRLAVPREDAEHLIGMPSLEDLTTAYSEMIPHAADWWATRFSRGDVRRVIAAEHTGLLGPSGA